MIVDEIIALAYDALEQGRPFALFAKPGDTFVDAMFQHDMTVSGGAGFIAQSFDGNRRYILPFAGSLRYKAEIERRHPFTGTPDGTSEPGKDAFLSLVIRALAAIAEGKFSKVVVSRREPIALQGRRAGSIFLRLLQEYPTAFRYWFFHPDAGMWMGATPEKLVTVDRDRFSIMSLAGTRLASGSNAWPAKEQHEQQVVTDYIASQLSPLVSELSVGVPSTHRAGSIEHIRTDISGRVSPDVIDDLVHLLHPTPAVCGFPKEHALAFLRSEEGYDRELYSGFLGLSGDNREGQPSTDLYVNLRCMKIEGDQAFLYMGCGITANSIAEDEYRETINKSMTIKKVLQ